MGGGGRGVDSKCKDPEVGVYSACSRNGRMPVSCLGSEGSRTEELEIR